MSRTVTRYVDFQTLKARGPSAATVIKLMMACNDLSLANQGLTEWKRDQPRSREPRRLGAGMYYIRMQFSHLHEGFKVIAAIRKDPLLMDLVSRCDRRTQASFRELETFLLHGANRKEFEHLIGKMRHNLAFHYDESGRLVERAISSLAAETDHTGAVTRGSTAHLWYFQAADRVINNVVCFQTWRIPGNAGVESEANKIADRCHQMFLWFVDFAGEFIWKYASSSS